MTIRLDTTSLVSGAVVLGTLGLGVPAELIPAYGENGAGYAYSSLRFPEDAGKEIRGFITRFPTNGTLKANEDTSFTYVGASDSFEWQLYVDGVAVGDPVTVTIVAETAVRAVILYNGTVTVLPLGEEGTGKKALVLINGTLAQDIGAGESLTLDGSSNGTLRTLSNDETLII
jgi:hypothetical protein